ncbi:hypothetical protein AB1K83_08105 [Sporosarcina sp. 179-K 3D1 HS]|uniref:hypothetical protein n=1 Tax=Sporosarcina sp. 179-K 3D1 HS TaxID=3232169 RepID=UPI0039A02BFC
MKNEEDFSKESKKPLPEVSEQSKGTPPKAAAMMQPDTKSPPRNRSLKRDDHLPPAAGEYEPYVKEDAVSPSNQARLSIIEKERNKDPHEPDGSSSNHPDTELD